MLGDSQTYRRGRLAIRFMMVMLPVFILCSGAALWFISDRNASMAKAELNARLAAVSITAASTLAQTLTENDTTVSQKILQLLLADRAIECAAVLDIGSSRPVLAAPEGIGCKGIDPVNSVEFAIAANSQARLHIRFNTNEVDAILRSQRDFTSLALLISVLIAAMAGYVAFRTIVDRPLQALLDAIRSSAQSGQNTHVELLSADELGDVGHAFNAMQDRLAKDAEALAREVERHCHTEDKLRIANSKVQTAMEILEEQYDKIEVQRDQLKTILDNMPHSVMWLDGDRNIMMRSRRAAELHGISEQEFQHVRTFYDFMGILAKRGDLGECPDDAARSRLVRQQVERLCRESDIKSGLRIHLPSQERWIQVRSAILPNGGCILGQHDITAQVSAERDIEQASEKLADTNDILEARVEERTRDLKALQQSLVDAERHSTYGKLASKICHELRNPLSAIALSLHVLRARSDKDNKAQKQFDRSERNLQRCSEILEDFHDFAFTRTLRRQTADICNWLQQSLARIDIPGDVELDTRLPSGPVYADIDGDKLGRALQKVLKNAIQAVTEAPGTDLEKKITLKAFEADGRFVIEVTDTGAGMSQETISQALEPLYSTRGFGVGLGLPIAQQCLSAHGGGIAIDSSTRANQTTVRMWLPLPAARKMAS